MAYNPSDQPPYPSGFDYPDPRLYQNPASYQRPRSRASSNAQPDGPVSDAVNNAFHNSDAASHVDPGLIAQITEQVRKKVIESLNISGGPYDSRSYASPSEPSGFSKGPPQNPPPQPYVPRSSTTSTTASFPPRDVYTPPSPHRYDHPDRSSPSPPLSQESTSFSAPFVSREEDERRYSAGEPSLHTANTSRLRPAAAPRAVTDEWLSPPASALEKAYGRLFDQYDQPTPRLGQLLRGLAIHIIEDYEPRNSLIITPAKMLKFYEDTRLDNEIYPWNKIFASLPNPAISKMYRDLKCQHHFVQDQYSEVPHLPALTPLGFQSWMTIMIQAHPETEYHRIAKAVLHMPISNADDKQERFPKELSRRLFPMQENLQARQRCAAALSADGKIPVPRSASFPPPPPAQPPPQPSSGSFERERQPYGHTDTSRTDSVFEQDGDDQHPPSIPIERERKPYVAKEGCGKIHEDISASTSSLKPDPTLRHQRSNSTSQGAGPRDPQFRTGEYTNPSGATASSSRHYRTQSHLNSGRRTRSPTGGFARSDGSNISDIPASEFSSNIYSTDREEDNRKFAKDAEMKRKEWERRHAEEDAARGPYVGRGGSAYEEDYYRPRGMSTGGYGAYGGYPPPPPRY